LAGLEAGAWIGMMPLSGLFSVLALALAIASFFWFRRAQMNARVFEADTRRQEQAVRMLDERFARGEIEREDYLKKRRDLFA
jgi:putative membrane protein